MERNIDPKIDRNLNRKMSEVERKDYQDPNLTTEKKEQIHYASQEIAEDVTEYGEFIATYFAWVPPEKQKERAEELQEMTEVKDNQEQSRNKKKKSK